MNEICVTKLDSETNVLTQFRRKSLTDQGPSTPMRAEKKDEIPIVSTVRTLQQYCAVLYDTVRHLADVLPGQRKMI